MSDLRRRIDALPKSCGVYLFKDEKGTVVYVGKAQDLLVEDEAQAALAAQ